MASSILTFDDDDGDNSSSDEDIRDAPRYSRIDKEKVDILVVGQTGHGKSTLINKLFGIRTKVTYGVQPTRHESSERYQVQIGNTTVTVYDTRGLGDRSSSDAQILQSLKSEQKSYDLVLICQRLFDKVDETTQKNLNHLAERLGDNLFEKSIYVFTFGDEYKSRCRVYERRHEYIDKDKLNDDLEKEMIDRKEEMKREFDSILKSAGISPHVIREIPACIVSGRKRTLPTTQDWIPELWNICIKRCEGDAKPFMDSWMDIYLKAAGYGVAAGLVGGARVGGVGGALLGAIAGGVGAMFIANEIEKDVKNKQK